MKKRSVLISVLSIVFSAMFLVVSSGTKAETQDGAEKDVVSVLHLEATGLLGPIGTSGKGGDSMSNPLRRSLVPLKEGLDAFLDLTSPPHSGLTSKDSRTDYRAVVGFHFRLR